RSLLPRRGGRQAVAMVRVGTADTPPVRAWLRWILVFAHRWSPPEEAPTKGGIAVDQRDQRRWVALVPHGRPCPRWLPCPNRHRGGTRSARAQGDGRDGTARRGAMAALVRSAGGSSDRTGSWRTPGERVGPISSAPGSSGRPR